MLESPLKSHWDTFGLVPDYDYERNSVQIVTTVGFSDSDDDTKE